MASIFLGSLLREGGTASFGVRLALGRYPFSGNGLDAAQLDPISFLLKLIEVRS